MKNFFWNFIKELFGNPPDKEADSGESKKTPAPIKRKELVKQIFEHYKMRFDEETTDRIMAFPTAFFIYLHPKDYAGQKQGFSLTVKNIVMEFNDFNLMKKEEYPDHIPHSNSWLFQFVKFDDGTIVDGVEPVQICEPQIVSTLYPKDFSKDNIGNEINVVATKRTKMSTSPVEIIDINIKAFLGMDMLDNDQFRVRLDGTYGKDVVVIRGTDNPWPDETGVLASLTCDKGFIGRYGKRGNKYNMTSDFIEISGSESARSGDFVVKIDSPLLQDQHLQIKHENGRFFIAAFGKVRLNEVSVSQSYGDPNWVPLSDNSRMMISGEIPMKFEISEFLKQQLKQKLIT